MEVITKRERIKSSVAQFLQLYGNGYAEQYPTYYNSYRANALSLLDTETCTEQEVITLLNATWTELRCDECKQFVDVVVHVGENIHSDYDSGACVCLSCLKAAVQKLEGL